ncbi:hypothetical protein ACOSP7_002045 [Xanthoceras sorbifolium]
MAASTAKLLLKNDKLLRNPFPYEYGSDDEVKITDSDLEKLFDSDETDEEEERRSCCDGSNDDNGFKRRK